jgi:hypothetical protein
LGCVLRDKNNFSDVSNLLYILGGFYRSFYRGNSYFQFGYLLEGLILDVILLATRK